jgi:hypothetical protein
MPYYIRYGNKVLADIENNDKVIWSEIDENTSRLVVSSFTSRKDAQKCFKQIAEINIQEVIGTEISNNLDYIPEDD